MQYNEVPAKLDPECQTTWIENQALHSVGPDLDPYCLQMNVILRLTTIRNKRKCLHYVSEYLEGTVYKTSKIQYLLIKALCLDKKSV